MDHSHVSWSGRVTAVPPSGTEASEENASSEETDCPVDNLVKQEINIWKYPLYFLHSRSHLTKKAVTATLNKKVGSFFLIKGRSVTDMPLKTNPL